MNSQELRALQEAYNQVYAPQELDEAAIYKRGGKGQTTETPLQIYGKSATTREKKKLHNIPKGRIGADEVGDYDRGSGNAAKRRAAALTKPEAKKFPNRLTRSDKQGIKDSYDLYDIILSHLLDEGYAETQEQAEVIMVNMSEDWRESIVEEVLEEGDNYDKNRKRAAQRAAARNAARDAGKTGAVPGVGYVTPRRERETYRDSAGTERHKTGARMPKD